VHWDHQQAEWAENARLGYRLVLDIAPVEHGAELVLHVVDRTGAELHGASVRVEAFANARSAERRTLELVEASDGTYRADIADPRPGLWEFRCAVSHGGERYTEVLRKDVTRSGAP
jgi:nitrogen fixation protein FixH